MSDTTAKIRNVDRRAFLATREGDILHLHTLSEIQQSNAGTEVLVKRHKLDDLTSARTLEDLVNHFGSHAIAYDPTRIIGRLRGVVRLAAEMRRQLVRDIREIAFEPRSRTLYVTLSQFHSVDDKHIGPILVKLALAARDGRTEGLDCHISVKLCAKLPSAAVLVPADRASIPNRALPRLFAGWKHAFAALGLTAFAAGPVAAQAVDGANAQAYGGSTVISDAKGDFGGKIAAPISDNVGAQVDIGAGTDSYLGAGAQLFLRDPEFGLLGLTASAESLDELELYRFGAKTELYLQALTVGARGGVQNDEGERGGFGGIDLSFYAVPDFALRGNADLSPDLELYRVGFEWRPGFDALPGLSMYSDFEHGSDGENAARVGLVYHFGEEGVSLMQRDRASSTATTIFNRRQIQYVS